MKDHEHPITEKRKIELEAELEMQKKRFLSSSKKGMEALRGNLSVATWLKSYPRESAIVILLGGFVAARMIRARRKAA